MIINFDCKETKKVFNGEFSKNLPHYIQGIAKRKLDMIHNAMNENDLRVPPSNHYEKLIGNLKDFISIKINDQFRIIFKYENNNAYNVKIDDYH